MPCTHNSRVLSCVPALVTGEGVKETREYSLLIYRKQTYSLIEVLSLYGGESALRELVSNQLEQLGLGDAVIDCVWHHNLTEINMTHHLQDNDNYVVLPLLASGKVVLLYILHTWQCLETIA